MYLRYGGRVMEIIVSRGSESVTLLIVKGWWYESYDEVLENETYLFSVE